ncbi:hypothetical protein [Helicobacter ailurogastricus]|uniref:Helix-turn-helix domain-containing protein n=1 Tax=Helicobacter ailurogastricus TaxID=1578720 RepID=A0A0K2X8E0_9HELI|nr:hypothetical protein [Helicobacter ailurogastricus]CRF41579.1 hypothetical protein HAL011_13820 [Helicobacter ailurogastricus]CRF42772.1 hypothetical protein HAL013_09790 [Helicobacter ailurogastricus]CRF43885.1 hypothetical protein HAL09_04430 [Helicobacter ailurogastricus]
MIVKIHNNEPFTRVSNTIIQKCNLSVQSMGVLLFIKSLPSNWKPNTPHLCKALKLSSRTLWKYINELIAAGVLSISRLRLSSGQLTDEYAFIFKEPDEELPPAAATALPASCAPAPAVRFVGEKKEKKYEEWEEVEESGELIKEKQLAPDFEILTKFSEFRKKHIEPSNLDKLSVTGSTCVNSGSLSDFLAAGQGVEVGGENAATRQKPFVGQNALKSATNPAHIEVSATRINFAPLKRNMEKKKHEISYAHTRACGKGEGESAESKRGSVWLKGREFVVESLEKIKHMADSCFNFDLSALEPLEVQAFEKFVTYRRECSKLSYGAKKAILERMLELKAKGEDLEACVAYSMRRGYRDLFPLISSKIERLESEDFKQDFKAKKAKRILDGLMRKFGFDYDNAADVLDQVCETYCEEFEKD